MRQQLRKRVGRALTFLTLKMTEPEFQRSQAKESKVISEQIALACRVFFGIIRENLLKQAHDEGSQSHAVAAELGTFPDFGDQAVKDPG